MSETPAQASGAQSPTARGSEKAEVAEGSNGDQLPQSLSAQNPATSINDTEGTRITNEFTNTIRRRSGASIDQRTVDSAIRSIGSERKDFVKGKRKTKPKEPSLHNLLMPDTRVCFPHWPSYLALFLFIAFWGGFITIGVISFEHGKPTRLTHPTDMFGFTCGEVNVWNGIQVDLRKKDLLYWLDPFELTNARNRWFAKGICVSSCPSPDDICKMADIPCLQNKQYRCPYYALAQDGLYNTLVYNETFGTEYFDALTTTTQQRCWATEQGIPQVFAAEASAFVKQNSVGAKRCGQFYQLTSQYPGTGPCYANWAYSTIHLNHCLPIWTPEVEMALAAYKKAHPNDTRIDDPLLQPISGWDIGIFLADVIHGWELIIFSGLVAPLLLAIVVMLCMQKKPGAVIWAGMFLCVATLAANTLLAFVKAGKIGHLSVGWEFTSQIPEGASAAGYARKLWVVMGSLFAFATAALLVRVFTLWRHVKAVILLFKVTSKVVLERPLTLLIPIVPVVVYSGLGLFWVWSTIYLYTSSAIEPVKRSSLDSMLTWWSPNSTLPIRAYELLNLTAHPSSPLVQQGQPLGAQHYADPTLACAYDPDCYLAIGFNTLLKHLFTYNYFGFWLANEFITTVTGVCICFYHSHRYFILNNSSRPAPMSLWTAMWYTWLALPPLIVGTVCNTMVDWFIVLRPICSMISTSRSKRKKEAKQHGQFYRIACSPFRGLGWLASRLMKYSDRHGYYCGALYNKTYWQGCRIACRMAEDNEERLAGAFEHAGSVFLFCKGAVAGLSILMAMIWSMTRTYSSALDFPKTYLTNALLPVFIVSLSAYFVAELWAQVYEATLATLLLGYCEDCRLNHGFPTMSPGLLIDTLQMSANEQAEREGGTRRAFNRFDNDLPQEEEVLDTRKVGVEIGEKSGKSMGTQF